jgi:diguanylate cyclase (GGDEF)-like protein
VKVLLTATPMQARERNWLTGWTIGTLVLIAAAIGTQPWDLGVVLEPFNGLFLLALVFLYGFHLRADRWMMTFGAVITYTIYVQYGLLAEWVVHGVALALIILWRRKWSWKTVLRWVNGSIWCSAAAAGAVMLTVEALPVLTNQVPRFAPYADDVAYLLVYVVFLYGLRAVDQYFQETGSEPVFFPNWKWETFTLFLLPPFALLMQAFSHSGDELAIVYLLIPLLAMGYIFYLYANMEDMQIQLTTIHDLSHAFAAELKLDKALAAFYEGLLRILPFQSVYLYELADDRQTLQLIDVNHMQNTLEDTPQQIRMDEPLMYPFTSKKLNHWRKSISAQLPVPEKISLLPMAWNRVVRGFVIIAHHRGVELRGRRKVLAEILIRQATVAIYNAKRYEMSKQKSRVDELTGLINQRHFETRLYQEIQIAQQTGKPFGVLLMDIDFFKKVNDTYGHHAGNVVLKGVAELLQKIVSDEDTVARYGGEEFCILLRGLDLRRSQWAAETIRQAIEQSVFRVRSDLQDDSKTTDLTPGSTISASSPKDSDAVDQSNRLDQSDDAILRDPLESNQMVDEMSMEDLIPLRITMSIGVCAYPDHAEDAHGLIRLADRAMYVGAKQAGRNRVAVYRK